MSATELLTRLQARGVVIEARGDRLHVEAPRGALTDADRTALAASKPDLLATLQAEAAEVAWRAAAMASQVPRRGAVPFLVARPGVSATPGTCWSCAAGLTDADDGPHRIRCRYCVRAAQRTINAVREGVTT